MVSGYDRPGLDGLGALKSFTERSGDHFRLEAYRDGAVRFIAANGAEKNLNMDPVGPVSRAAGEKDPVFPFPPVS